MLATHKGIGAAAQLLAPHEHGITNHKGETALTIAYRDKNRAMIGLLSQYADEVQPGAGQQF